MRPIATILAMAVAALACAPSGEAPRQPVEILADDVFIHLGDQADLRGPWRPILGFSTLATRWRGEFYLTDPRGAWQLEVEVMQPNDRSNRVRINDQPLAPAFLPGRDWDYANYYTKVRLRVPPGVLRAGLNVIEVHVGPWIPSFQRSVQNWDDLQFRAVRLVPTPSLVDDARD